MGRKSQSRRSQAVPGEQLTFGAAMGIRRKGGGRKKSPDSGVGHMQRERVTRHVPVHVVDGLVEGLSSLRTPECFRAIRAAICAGRERAGRRADGEFRVVEYSVQENHLHLMVEAGDADALARGVAGLKIRIAKGLNRLRRRKGKVWKDRFFARLLRTPAEVRNALRYIFANARKHGRRVARGVPDPFSSAVWFEGWCDYDHRFDPYVTTAAPTAEPRSWLRRVGWRMHGLLSVP
jgi:REP element-mobilizing transposase RayT